jgi:hypothetical protein
MGGVVDVRQIDPGNRSVLTSDTGCSVTDNCGPSLKVPEMVACHSERGYNRFRVHLLLSIKIWIGVIRSV